MKYEYNGTQFEAVFGKIEELEFDAVALPTTPSLLMDSGITSKIKNIAGQGVEDEAVKRAPGMPGDAVMTGAGDISSKHIFHCVMLDDNKNASPDSLAACIKTVFEKAEKEGFKKLAFPAVGASFPGLDPKVTTEIIVEQAIKSVDEKTGFFTQVCFIVCDSAPYVYFKKILKKKFKKKSGKEKT